MSKVATKDLLNMIDRLESDLKDLRRLVRSLDITPEHEELPGEEGVFDGVYMILDSGEKLKVPENYAAKSRLVYGDRLKKVILDGTDKYKQVVKVSRKEVEGIVTRKEGVWHVLTEFGSHEISQNAAEYNNIKLNDHVVVVLPEKNPSVPFAALERVVVAEPVSSIKKDSKPINSPKKDVVRERKPERSSKPKKKPVESEKPTEESREEKKSEENNTKDMSNAVTSIDDDDDLR